MYAIWDVPGIRVSRDNVSWCRRDAHAVIFVYDITRQDSLRNARRWFDILRSLSSPDIFKVFAGNKADLVSEREVTYEVICVSIALRQA